MLDIGKIENMVKIRLSIPEYYKKFIDSNVNLEQTSKVCSPFREETRPSFSYSRDLNIWKDFGNKKGGDIVDLHRWYKGFENRYEATLSLAQYLSIPMYEKETGRASLLHEIEKLLDKDDFEEEEEDPKEQFTSLNVSIERRLKMLDSPTLYCKYDKLMSYDINFLQKQKAMRSFYESIC